MWAHGLCLIVKREKGDTIALLCRHLAKIHAWSVNRESKGCDPCHRMVALDGVSEFLGDVVDHELIVIRFPLLSLSKRDEAAID